MEHAVKAEHLGEMIERVRETGRELLLTDISLANTLLDRAGDTHDDTTRARNIDNAVHAYTTIQRLKLRLQLDGEPLRQVDQLLLDLRQRLREFGASLPPP